MSPDPQPLPPGVGPPASGASINGLILNIVVPGLGSLIGGRTGVGVAQIVLFGVGVLLCLTLIGILIGGPMIVGAWIWGLVTGISMMSQGTAPQPPPPGASGP